MNYETPEVVEIGSAQTVILGSDKPTLIDGDFTGPNADLVVIDEEVE